MSTIYLHDKKFGTLEEDEMQTFLTACDSYQLAYIQRDETSWQLLPQLQDTTLVLKPLEASPVLHSFIQNLKSQLTWHGALVIVEPDLKINADLFKVLRAQIAISFTEHVPHPDNYDMHFYYSLRAKEESMDFIGGLVKQLSKTNANLTYNLASYWEHITCFKYRKIIFSQVPTVLVEFTNMAALDKFLHDIAFCLVNNILDIYGHKAGQAELEKLADCFALATRKIPPAVQEAATHPLKEDSPEHAPSIPTENIEQPELAVEGSLPGHDTPEPASVKISSKNNKGTTAIKSIPSKAEESKENAPKSKLKSHDKLQPTSTRSKKSTSKKRHYGKANPLSPPGSGPVNYFTRPSGPVNQPLHILNYMKRNALATQLLNTYMYHSSGVTTPAIGNKITISKFNSKAENFIYNRINTPNRCTVTARSTFYQPPAKPEVPRQESLVRVEAKEQASSDEEALPANLEALKDLEKILES